MFDNYYRFFGKEVASVNQNDVFIKDVKIYEYQVENFNPSKIYPEGIDISLKSDSKIYDQVRTILHDMGLDKKNYGSKDWNPFGDFIKTENKVVIKPNLVHHINACIDGNTDSLITNFSIIRPLIDYTLLALKGTGSLIVGDAPVQECDFASVIKLNHLEESIRKYNKQGYVVELMDFRKNNNEDLECQIVSMGKNSAFVEVDEYDKKYAITNYNLKYMHEHHHDGIHEYLVPKCVLEADVIINVPKPKTHRKAGMTACMKNFVGINGKKEYLPHHRNGNIHHNGDEFPERSLLKSMQSKVKNYTYTKNSFVLFFNRGLGFMMRKLHKDKFREGSWYGNDTIWRTIIDINKLILYADKQGHLTNQKQRIIFNFADMIVSGEKEGPLLPTNKKVGMMVASFNQLNMDKTICSIMGFEPNKIKYIVNGYKLKDHTIALDNFKIYTGDKVVKDVNVYNKHFEATEGWRDYLN